jgi:hypothetical protein
MYHTQDELPPCDPAARKEYETALRNLRGEVEWNPRASCRAV